MVPQANNGRVRGLLRRWLFVNPTIRELHGRVLDMGCGDGVYMRAYAGESEGIDIDQRLVKLCQCLDLHVTVDDAESYTTSSEFDCVLIHYLLEHVSHPRKVLARADAVLKSKGRIVITVPCVYAFMLGFNDTGGHKQFITLRYLDDYLVGELGYSRVKSCTFPFVELPVLRTYQELRCVYEKP